MVGRFLAVLGLVAGLLATPAVAAVTAPDPTTAGSYTAVGGSYKIKASKDPSVTANAVTERWARVWFPRTRTTPAPLVVMLHGEHGTCGRLDADGWRIDDRADYSATGKCPSGYKTTPNHLGYDYIGERLATQGYIVVSINANRGVNQTEEIAAEADPGNILRRGRLILRHIEALGRYNAGTVATPSTVGVSLKGRIDFTRVALFGHSRGGDAVVAAYRLLGDSGSGWKAKLPAGTKIRALVSVAPTERQTGKAAVAGVSHGILLPMCDADVIRLDGVRFYDRAVVTYDSAGSFRATFSVVGANHNGFNTEWHTADSYDFAKGVDGTHDCPGQTKLFPVRGRSESQKTVGLLFTTAVIRAAIENQNFARVLNPSFAMPAVIPVSIPVDRGYQPKLVGASTNRLLVRFDGSCATKALSYTGVTASCGHSPEHDVAKNWILRVRWGKPASTAFTHYNAFVKFNGGVPVDFAAMSTLELRIAPDCNLAGATLGNPYVNFRCAARSSQGGGLSNQAVYAILTDAQGRFSAYVDLRGYTRGRETVGITKSPTALPYASFHHALLSSARIPTVAFKAGDFDLTRVTGMFITSFTANGSGGLMLGDVFLSKAGATLNPFTVRASRPASAALPPLSAMRPATDGLSADEPGTARAAFDPPAAGRLVSIVRPDAGRIGAPAGEVVIAFVPQRPLIETDSGLFVRIGDRTVQVRRVAASAPGTEAVSVPAAVLASARAGDGLAVIGAGSVWLGARLTDADLR